MSLYYGSNSCYHLSNKREANGVLPPLSSQGFEITPGDRTWNLPHRRPCTNQLYQSLLQLDFDLITFYFTLYFNKQIILYLFIYLLIVRSCPPLVEVAGTSVSPKDCLVVGARKVKDTCTFSCKEGYKLPDPKQPTLTCLDTGAWDKAVINCQRE